MLCINMNIINATVWMFGWYLPYPSYWTIHFAIPTSHLKQMKFFFSWRTSWVNNNSQMNVIKKRLGYSHFHNGVKITFRFNFQVDETDKKVQCPWIGDFQTWIFLIFVISCILGALCQAHTHLTIQRRFLEKTAVAAPAIPKQTGILENIPQP